MLTQIQLDIDRYGIAHNRCIDGDLITRLAWDDKVLMDFMKVKIQQMPAPSLFEDSPSLPDGGIILPHNQFFLSAHKNDPQFFLSSEQYFHSFHLHH